MIALLVIVVIVSLVALGLIRQHRWDVPDVMRLNLWAIAGLASLGSAALFFLHDGWEVPAFRTSGDRRTNIAIGIIALFVHIGPQWTGFFFLMLGGYFMRKVFVGWGDR